MAGSSLGLMRDLRHALAYGTYRRPQHRHRDHSPLLPGLIRAGVLSRSGAHAHSQERSERDEAVMRPVLTNPPATSATISSLEEETGTLPDSYKRFLLTSDGGIPEPPFFRSAYYVQEFFSAGGDTTGSVRGNIRSFENMFRGGCLPELLPIACDWGGNVFFLSLSTGCVLFWDHEESPEQPPKEVVAASFDAFIAAFEPPPED